MNRSAADDGQTEKVEQSSRVVAGLLTLIEKRQYLPGERLPSERDLAERFSVGRATVREAVTTLESMRYIERRPGSGIFRCREPERASLEALVLFSDLGLPLDPKTNAEVIEVRRMIEVQAIGLACERRETADIGRIEDTLWYSPGVRNAVRYEYKDTLGTARNTHEIQELVRFWPGK